MESAATVSSNGYLQGSNKISLNIHTRENFSSSNETEDDDDYRQERINQENFQFVTSPVSDASFNDDDDKDDVMDGQNQSFNNGRSAPFTPANSPPLSSEDNNKSASTSINNNIENEATKNNSNSYFKTLHHSHSHYSLQHQPLSARHRLQSHNHHHNNNHEPNLLSHHKRLRMSEDHSSNGPLVLPPIRSFASSWTPLDQFAAISEAVRSDSQRALKSPRLAKPEVSELSSSPEDSHHYQQQQHVTSKNSVGGSSQEHEREHLLRRSSFDTSQMRYSPLTPSVLNPYAARLPPSSFLERRHSDSPAAQARNLEASRVTSPGSSYSTYGGAGVGIYAANANPNSNNNNGYASSPHMSMPQHLSSPYHDPSNGASMVKAKRKRANANQLKVLNEVFQHTFFPSTELRIQLGKQLGMSPRTVQIWFQNKRQSWRSKTRASTTNGGAQGDDDQGMNPEEMDTNDDNNGSTGNEHRNNLGRRSSNSSMSSSDEEEQDQRSMPDSPLDSSSSYYRNNGGGDYFSRSQLNSSSESINGTSSTYSQLQQHNHHQQNYHPSPSSSSIHQNEEYFHSSHHHGHVSGSNISNSSSPLSPSSLLNRKPSGERLPNIVSSTRLPAPISNNANSSSPPSSSHRHHIHQPLPPTSSFGYTSMVNTGGI
ncbi:3959_t:CDS:2 [Ambispora gerdemannii]|uniref:3959_t:CDS:1 n=1 Tax=Ambispora gerdemannii TaxID=144530 RepID=A0A9N9F5N6_9GLOM|nr:3959_t:CDS:2 [Ambispora gerdemannii]